MRKRTLLERVSRRFHRTILEKFKTSKLKNLEKLGTSNGGWTIPQHFFKADSICYLAGAGEDISFDVGMADKYHSQVYIFDPTPRAIKHFNQLREHIISGERMPINQDKGFYQIDTANLSNLHFQDIGLWKSNEEIKFYAPDNKKKVSHSILNLQHQEDFFIGKVRRLKNVMETYGHKYLDMLKIDIEGAEYEVIDSIIEDELDIKVLGVAYDEFTKPLDSGAMQRIISSANKICNYGYKLVFVDPSRYKTCFVKNEIYSHLSKH